MFYRLKNAWFAFLYCLDIEDELLRLKKRQKIFEDALYEIRRTSAAQSIRDKAHNALTDTSYWISNE